MKIGPILGKKCPRCEKVGMFSGWFRMHETCHECGFKYEREEGYFTGAVMFSSIFTTFLITPIWFWVMLEGYSFWYIFLAALIPSIIISPLVFQYSRVVWLYMDFKIFHPE